MTVIKSAATTTLGNISADNSKDVLNDSQKSFTSESSGVYCIVCLIMYLDYSGFVPMNSGDRIFFVFSFKKENF